MERLSLMDQAMHKMTTTGVAAMNMQGASVFNPKRAPYRVNKKILAEHLAARLQEAPILRKRLIQDPLLLGDLKMVDDPDFDVWNHITFSTLPPPGDLRTLTRRLSRFSAEELDPDRPLWCFEIIDGLNDGRLVIAQKFSHATMDGMAASRVMDCIHDTRPQRPDRYRPLSWSPEPLPSKLQLLGSAARETADRFVLKPPRVAAKVLGLGAHSLAKAAGKRLRGDASSASSWDLFKVDAYPTSLTKGGSSDQSNIGYAVFELDKLKALSRSMDCTLNDLCLLMISEAMGAYFAGIAEQIDFDLVVSMPLDTRQESDREFGNAVTGAMVSLHNTIPGLEERLDEIQSTTTQIKKAMRGDDKIDMSILSEVSSIIPPLTLDVLCHAMKILHLWDKISIPANAVFTNVRGPNKEVYVAGMPIEIPIPIIPTFPPGMLSIGGSSIGNHFSFGFHVCDSAVKEENMHFFVDGLNSVYRQLIRQNRPAKSKPKRKPKQKTK